MRSTNWGIGSVIRPVLKLRPISKMMGSQMSSKFGEIGRVDCLKALILQYQTKQQVSAPRKRKSRRYDFFESSGVDKTCWEEFKAFGSSCPNLNVFQSGSTKTQNSSSSKVASLPRHCSVGVESPEILLINLASMLSQAADKLGVTLANWPSRTRNWLCKIPHSRRWRLLVFLIIWNKKQINRWQGKKRLWNTLEFVCVANVEESRVSCFMILFHKALMTILLSVF